MKKITREMIETIVYNNFSKMTEKATDIMSKNIDICEKEYGYLKGEQLNGVKNMFVPTSTAYQLSMYMIAEILCELFCAEETEDELSNENNIIILEDGQSLTVQKGEHRIEIGDNGVVVANL